MDKKAVDLDFKAIEREIENLLATNKSMSAFLFFLKTRQRTSSSTDLLHIASFINNDALFKSFGNVSTKEVREILISFAQLGIGSLEGLHDSEAQTGRETFHWKHWVFPLYDPRTKLGAPNTWTCFGLEIKPLIAFQKNRNHLKTVKAHTELLEQMYASGTISKKIDVSLKSGGSPAKTQLRDLSLEELTTEIERRGWSITLTKNKETKKRNISKK